MPVQQTQMVPAPIPLFTFPSYVLDLLQNAGPSTYILEAQMDGNLIGVYMGIGAVVLIALLVVIPWWVMGDKKH